MNLKRNSKQQEPKTRLTDFPSYVSALDKVNELKDEGAKLLAAILQLESGAGDIDDVGLAAAQLVGGGVAVAAEPSVRLKDARQQQEIVHRATELAEKELGKARAEASAEILEAKFPAYRVLVQQYADNLQALADAWDKLQRFHDDIRRAHVDPRPPISKVRWPFRGHIATTLKEAFLRLERQFDITPKRK